MPPCASHPWHVRLRGLGQRGELIPFENPSAGGLRPPTPPPKGGGFLDYFGKNVAIQILLLGLSYCAP